MVRALIFGVAHGGPRTLATGRLLAVTGATLMRMHRAAGALDGLRHWRRAARISDDPASDPGRDDLDRDHDRKDHEQDKTRLVPVEVGHCGFERHAQPAAADEAEHGGFTHVDVPAKRRD